MKITSRPTLINRAFNSTKLIFASSSRRKLLTQFGIVFVFFVPAPFYFAQPQVSTSSESFDMLVVGDSHISGQGLSEKNKFYYLVKEWIQNDVFAAERTVNLKVKAHSGARIEIHADELKKLQKAGDDIYKFHHIEATLSQPSITAQIDFARKEYADPMAVDLVMLSGGITDILVANTINPFLKESKLRELIHRYCNQAMFDLLEHVMSTFPNANVVVVGYFPIISTKSDIKAITRYLFKAVKFPHVLQPILTNVVSRQFLKILRKKMTLRSRLWVAESNRETRDAIARINAKLDAPRVLYVESPITEESSFGTRGSHLWGTDKDNYPADEKYRVRKEICPKVFAELKHHHYGKMSVRMCELAAIGHPNVEGSHAYAKAISRELRPLFTSYAASKKP
ncbi:MAG: hypothetical protein WBD22_04440 [Pyrinomonadaceae bacterium]